MAASPCGSRPRGDRLERIDDVAKRERIALGDEGSEAARQAGQLVEGRWLGGHLE